MAFMTISMLLLAIYVGYGLILAARMLYLAGARRGPWGEGEYGLGIFYLVFWPFIAGYAVWHEMNLE